MYYLICQRVNIINNDSKVNCDFLLLFPKNVKKSLLSLKDTIKEKTQ